MRHIATTEALLRRQIEALRPGWLARAGSRAARLRVQGRYAEKDAIWSEIKPVFMALQHNKCAFCERKLEGPPFGHVEHDMEHFRPKGAVKKWPTDELAPLLRYRFSTGGDHPRGYPCLAYSPLNYVAACKPCNTALKASHFPIAGRRSRASSHDVAAYAREDPLLIYPLGDVDEPPESLLTFRGLTPIPVASRGPRRRRAIVTIDFFRLHTRPDLLRERAEKLTHLFFARRFESQDPVASQLRRYLVSPDSAHTSCVRAFDALCDRDPIEAERMFSAAHDYLYPARPSD